MKKCFKCGAKKGLDCFYKHPQKADGLLGKCKECAKADNKKSYQKNIQKKREYDRYRIRYNFRRIFQHRYRSMLQRINGTATRPYKVEGRDIADRQKFIEWCYSKEVFEQFQKLHQKWVMSGFERALAPSIDRIDNKRGYTLDNIRWITVLENVQKYNH